jgi:hypothetical protein
VDVGAVAYAVAGLLAAKTGEGLAGEAGKSAWAGVGRLYAVVRAKLTGDTAAEAALDRLQARPQDQTRVAALAQVVQTQAQLDPRFCQAIEELVDQARQDRSAERIMAWAFDQARQVNIARDMYGNISL